MNRFVGLGGWLIGKWWGEAVSRRIFIGGASIIEVSIFY